MGNDIFIALQIYGIGIVIAAVIATLIKSLTILLGKFAEKSEKN